MITSHATFRVAPGREAEFHAAALALTTAAVAEPGTTRYDWYSGTDPATFLVVEEYADAAAAVLHNDACADLLRQLGEVAELVTADLAGDLSEALLEWVAGEPRARAFVAAETQGVPLVAGIAHVGLTVPDLVAALHMWCDDLGFVLERTFTLDEVTTAGTTGIRSSTIHAATVVLGQHRVELLEYRPAPAEVARAFPSHSGATHIALTVTDLDHVLRVCRGHGWVPVGAPHRLRSRARAGTDIVYLHGAAGGTLELIAPPRG